MGQAINRLLTTLSLEDSSPWLHSCGGLHSNYAHWQLSLRCYSAGACIYHVSTANLLYCINQFISIFVKYAYNSAVYEATEEHDKRRP